MIHAAYIIICAARTHHSSREAIALEVHRDNSQVEKKEEKSVNLKQYDVDDHLLSLEDLQHRSVWFFLRSPFCTDARLIAVVGMILRVFKPNRVRPYGL